MIKAYSGHYDDDVADTMMEQTEIKARDLAGPSPDPIECDLANAAATLYLDWSLCALNDAYSVKLRVETVAGWWNALENRKDGSCRRYLSALRSLGAYRKILPMVQINLAKINVGSVKGSRPRRPDRPITIDVTPDGPPASQDV
jgi:hypothetical protein